MKRSMTVAVCLATCYLTSQARGDVVTEGFESGTFAAFSTLGGASILDAGFGTAAHEGLFQAGITNGSGRAGGAFCDANIELILGLGKGDLDALVGLDVTEGAALVADLYVNGGGRLEFMVNFLTNELTPDPDFNDMAFFSVVDSNGVVQELSLIADTFSSFERSSSSDPMFGSFARETGYFSTSFVAPADGIYRVGFGVMDVGDVSVSSALLIDAVPEPSSCALFGLASSFLLARLHRRGRGVEKSRGSGK